MTRVAVIVLDVAVLEVERRQRIALHVPEILHEGGHRVAGRARSDGGGVFEAVRERQERDHQGNERDGYEEPPAGRGRDCAGTEAAPGEGQEHEVQDREGDPEAAHPVARSSRSSREVTELPPRVLLSIGAAEPAIPCLGCPPRRRHHRRSASRRPGRWRAPDPAARPSPEAPPCDGSWRCARAGS